MSCVYVNYLYVFPSDVPMEQSVTVPSPALTRAVAHGSETCSPGRLWFCGGPVFRELSIFIC